MDGWLNEKINEQMSQREKIRNILIVCTPTWFFFIQVIDSAVALVNYAQVSNVEMILWNQLLGLANIYIYIYWLLE